MGTRSTIALEFADGTVEQVYCHWDGYLSHNGAILSKHYSDPFKLRDLIDLGDLSSLAENIGTKHNFSDRVDGECTFYARDRSETGCEAKKFASFADYKDNHQYEEYEYILRTDGLWYVGIGEGVYIQLASALASTEECV
jgi:hypothetical protein